MMPVEVTRRAVCEADWPLLFELYASTRSAELELTPWTPGQRHAFLSMQFEAQTAGYRAAHPHASHEMILAGGCPVGRLYLDGQPDVLHILDITIAPQSRNAGIGSLVLREILDEANREGKAVTIYVESFNPSARLFERLGFQQLSIDGFQMFLEYKPEAVAADRKQGTVG